MYEIYKDNVTWDEARDRCISDGGDLAVIYTHEQIQELENIVTGVDSFHIGIHKPHGILDWISVNDGKFWLNFQLNATVYKTSLTW